MLLSDITDITYYPVGKALLCVPSVFLSMINVRLETQTEVFAYACKRRFADTRMPEFSQIVFSPIRLNPDCALIRISIVNKPGKFKEVTRLLRQNNINILKTDDTTIGTRGIIEMYLDLSGATLHDDELDRLFTRLTPETIQDHTIPETLQELCGLDFHGDIMSRIRIMASSSVNVQIPLERGILDVIGVDWLPSSQEDSLKAKAIISTYVRFPMLISALLPPGQELIRIKASLEDKPGALDEVLGAVGLLTDIYASDTTEYREGYTSWDAIAFLTGSARPEQIENALEQVAEKWVDKKTISVKRIDC